jgi:hypothetical protein
LSNVYVGGAAAPSSRRTDSMSLDTKPASSVAAGWLAEPWRAV